MAKKILLILCCLHVQLQAQPLTFRVDREAMHADPTALTVFNNPVASARQEQVCLAMGQQRGFLLRELDRHFASILWPLKNAGVFSGAYTGSGTADFSQQYVSSGFARKFGNAMAAYAGGWIYSVKQGEGYGAATVPGAQAGFSAKLGKSVSVSSLLRLPAVKNDFLFPAAIFQSGISINCSPSCSVEGGGTLQPGHPFEFAGGIFYKPLDKVAFRIGVNSGPFAFYGGANFRVASFSFDLSFSHQPDVGLSPRITLAFNPEKKK